MENKQTTTTKKHRSKLLHVCTIISNPLCVYVCWKVRYLHTDVSEDKRYSSTECVGVNIIHTQAIFYMFWTCLLTQQYKKSIIMIQVSIGTLHDMAYRNKIAATFSYHIKNAEKNVYISKVKVCYKNIARNKIFPFHLSLHHILPKQQRQINRFIRTSHFKYTARCVALVKGGSNSTYIRKADESSTT